MLSNLQILLVWRPETGTRPGTEMQSGFFQIELLISPVRMKIDNLLYQTVEAQQFLPHLRSVALLKGLCLQ